MKKIYIEEVENGFYIEIKNGNAESKYVWRNLDAIRMLEWLGRFLNGQKVYVTEDTIR